MSTTGALTSHIERFKAALTWDAHYAITGRKPHDHASLVADLLPFLNEIVIVGALTAGRPVPAHDSWTWRGVETIALTGIVLASLRGHPGEVREFGLARGVGLILCAFVIPNAGLANAITGLTPLKTAVAGAAAIYTLECAAIIVAALTFELLMRTRPPRAGKWV